MKQEYREIKPYQEIIEILNLGYEDEKMEVKIGNNMSKEVQGKLCDLLKEFKMCLLGHTKICLGWILI